MSVPIGDLMTQQTHLYVGGYTHESAVGIHIFDASDPAGRLDERGEFDGVEHPSFLATHPNGNVLYAVSETASAQDSAVVALRIDHGDGSLAMLDRVPSQGSAPCHVSVASDGRFLYAANYLSGTIAVYSLDVDGSFGELVAAPRHRGSGPHVRQDGPHAHCVVPGPTDRIVYAVDLGTDRVYRYAHHPDATNDAFGLEAQFALQPGTGPRHLAFHPHESVAFIVGELDSTVVTAHVDPMSGELTRGSVCSTLPGDFVGESIAAEIRVHPNGRHVYVSNRGHDSIAMFKFVGPGAPLVPLGHTHSGGRTPRNFGVHPAGRALLAANQDSHTLVPFEIDPATGLLDQLDVGYHVSEPTCLAFLEVTQ